MRNKNLIFVIPFLIYAISLTNGWNYVDDHEIAFFSYFSKSHSFIDTLRLTEVFQWGEFKRFRPSYYPLRILESKLWGANLFFWYFFRLLIQFFFLREVYEWAKSKLSDKESLMVLLMATSMLYWRELQTRLGPGETYCVLGVALISLSLRLQKYRWIYFLGAILAIGSKENFVITPVLILFYLYGMKRLTWKDIVLNLILMGYCLFIGIGILKAISTGNGDIYMNKTDPLTRILGLAKGLLTIQIVPYLLLGWGLISKRFKLSREELTLVFISGTVLLFNLVFYSGTIPDGSRYDFPAVPMNLMAWVIAYQKFQRPQWQKAIMIILLGFAGSGLYRQAAKAIRWNTATRSFTENLEKLVLDSKAHKNILIVSTDARDFEPVVFIPRYLRAMGVEANFYLKPQIEATGVPYLDSYKGEMELISKSGNTEFTPMNSLQGDCLQVDYFRETQVKDCAGVTRFSFSR